MERFSMEWIKAIIEKHTKEDGKVDVEAVNAEVKTEFPKNAVPKVDFNAKVEELKTANETLTTLQKDNKDAEALQTEIATYKSTVETLQKEQAATAKQQSIESALRDAKATDVEYMAHKLGDVALDKDGKLIKSDLDNKIKELQENNPTFFPATGNSNPDNTTPGQTNLKPIVKDLKDGKPTAAFTMEQVRGMSTEEINNNWDAVQATLQGGND